MEPTILFKQSTNSFGRSHHTDIGHVTWTEVMWPAHSSASLPTKIKQVSGNITERQQFLHR